VTHPLADAGHFASREPDAPFVIEGSYFGRRRFEGTVRARRSRDDVPRLGPTRSRRTRALEDTGLRIEALREPAAPAEEQDPRWQRMPMFLMFRASAG
jgi:hypothetical protein